jgi:hypothetical protein
LGWTTYRIVLTIGYSDFLLLFVGCWAFEKPTDQT